MNSKARIWIADKTKHLTIKMEKTTTDNVTQNLDLATSMEQKKSEYEVDRLNQSTYVAADEESEISQS